MALHPPGVQPFRWSMTPVAGLETTSFDDPAGLQSFIPPHLFFVIEDVHVAYIEIPPNVNRVYKVGPWCVAFDTDGQPHFNRE